MINFDFFYALILRAIVSNGYDSVNRRTGERVLNLQGGTSIYFFIDNMMPLISGRKTYPKTMAAEVAWYLKGTQDVRWLQKYAKMWDLFVEDDGFTVKNAYGYRWRNHFGRDQLKLAVDTLAEDWTSRQAVISAWDPSSDGLGNKDKNVPCPAMFTFNIKPGELGTEYLYLHTSLFLRSSDFIVGLPYDIGGHALLMDAFCQSLSPRLDQTLKLGTVHASLADAHIYGSHLSIAGEMLEEYDPKQIKMPLPGWSIEEIEKDPDGYVEYVGELAKGVDWPSFNPRPPIVK